MSGDNISMLQVVVILMIIQVQEFISYRVQTQVPSLTFLLLILEDWRSYLIRQLQYCRFSLPILPHREFSLDDVLLEVHGAIGMNSA